MAKTKPKPQSLWISQNAADSVKIFEVTLGRLPSYGFNLRLVNGLPLLEIISLPNWIKTVNKFIFLFCSTFVVALFLLIFQFKSLSSMQIVQLLVLLAGLVLLSFIYLVRHFVQRNWELVHHINSIYQSNPTSKSSESHDAHIHDSRYYDLSGIMLLLIIFFLNVSCVPMIILCSYLGLGPMQMTAEQIFNLPLNKFICLLDIVSLVVSLPVVLFRQGFIILFIAVTLFNRIDAELVSLHTYPLQYTEFVCLHYNLMQCRYLRISEDISILTGYGIIIMQVLLCVQLWTLVNGRRLLPVFLLLICAGFLITDFVVTLMYIKTQSNCRISSENLITKHVNGFRVYGVKGGTCGYLRRLWKCKFSLKIYCAKQFIIGRDAIINFLDVFSSNATNLLILVTI